MKRTMLANLAKTFRSTLRGQVADMLPDCRRQRTAIIKRRTGGYRSYEQLENRWLMAVLDTFLTNEHVDLNIGYGGGAEPWSISPTLDSGTAYAADRALLYIGEQGATTRLANTDFNFIGVPAGATYYRLPATQDPDVLYLGAAGNGVTPSLLDVYSPNTQSKGRVSGSSRWIRSSLVSVAHTTPTGAVGSGVFSMWQNDLSSPVVFVSNFNDGVSNPNSNGFDATDGISSDDAFWVLAGGHSHFNFGFSVPGRYEVTFRTSAYFGSDGNNTTPNVADFRQSGDLKLYFSVLAVGQLQLSASSYTVDEAAGTASVTVNRVGAETDALLSTTQRQTEQPHPATIMARPAVRLRLMILKSAR